MGRDARIGRRNALVIPGWLLIVYSLAAILYAEAFRAQSDFCADGSLVLINGLCYTVWKLVLPLLLIGIGLAVGGALGFQGKPERLEQHLRHGSPSIVLFALLISFIAVPVLALAVQLYRQSANGVTYQVELLGVAYQHVFLLELAVLIAAMILVPFGVALIGDMRRRHEFLTAAATPRAEGGLGEGMDATPEPDDGFEEAEDWPDSRSDEGEETPVAPMADEAWGETEPEGGFEAEDAFEETEDAFESVEDWPDSRSEEGDPEEASVAWVDEDRSEADDQAPEDGPEVAEDAFEETDDAFESVEDWPDSRTDEGDEEEAPAESVEEAISETGEEPREDATFLGYHVAAEPVIDVEGVGEAYAKKLGDAGVATTARLLAEEPADLAARSGIAIKHIESWQKMIELTAVKGIGPQYAEALVRAGISGVAELKRRSAATLAKQVQDYLDSLDNHVLGTSITEARIRSWQEAAKGMRKARQLVPKS